VRNLTICATGEDIVTGDKDAAEAYLEVMKDLSVGVPWVKPCVT